MSQGGSIALHRKFVEWEWYPEAFVKAVFIDLIIHANYKDGRYKGTEIKRGQLITSYQAIADRNGMHRNTVVKWMKKLIDTGEITIEGKQGIGLKVTITNYDEYQKPFGTKEPKVRLEKYIPKEKKEILNPMDFNNDDLWT